MSNNPKVLYKKAKRQFKTGKYEACVTSCKLILAKKSGEAEVYILAARAFQKLGRSAEAIDLLERAALAFEKPEIHQELAEIYQGRGQHERVHLHLTHVIKMGVKDTDTYVRLAWSLVTLEKNDLAEQVLIAADRNEPRAPKVWVLFSHVMAVKGDFEKAAQFAAGAYEANPESSQALANLVLRALKLSKASVASRLCQELEDRFPDYPGVTRYLADCYAAMGEWDKALASFEKSMEEDEPNVYDMCRKCEMLLEAGYFEEAAESTSRTLKKFPDAAQAHGLKGSALMFLGDLEGAKVEVKKSIELFDGLSFPYYRLAELYRGGIEEKYVDRMKVLFGSEELTLEGRANAAFGLGMVMEGRKKYDEAFEYFCRGNDLLGKAWRKEGLPIYHTKDNEKKLMVIKALWKPGFFDHIDSIGSDSEMPVLVVGMPRSGTTLIHQILASHSKVFGAGESKHLNRVIATYLGGENPQEKFGAETKLVNSQEVLVEAGKDYLRGVMARAPEGILRCVDKMPLNAMLLGQARLIFPNIKIIYVKRNPLDTCVSNFNNKFLHAYEYSIDLESLGHFSNIVSDTMDHWIEVFGDNILTVEYEELIQNQETESRRMIEFVGLDWEEACLDFHLSKSVTLTFSATQIREKINRKSVDKWRRYEKHLGPLIAALETKSQSEEKVA